MEVLRLDPVTYLPNALIEGYSSMIWTERYTSPGEFEMKTPLIAEMRALLPEMTLITLRDTNEVMFVETQAITVDNDGNPELTVTGTTLDGFLPHRYITQGPLVDKWYLNQGYAPCYSVAVLLWNALVNPTDKDVTGPELAGTRSVYDTISNFAVSVSTTFVGTNPVGWCTPGPIDTLVREWLALDGLGLRGIKPPSTMTQKVTIDTTGAVLFGYCALSTETDSPKLRLDIYNGLNRSVNQVTFTPVILRYDTGHIEKPNYLFSVKNLKTSTWWTVPGVTNEENWDFGEVGIRQGLRRRNLYFDIGKQKDGQALLDYQEEVRLKGIAELRNYRHTRMFTADVSPYSDFKYNVHYNLGDTVTLIADYGITRDAQVVEYIRTEDETGDHAYPGLV